MRLSTHLGLPIAEPDDARRDFPTVVDGPRTDGFDAAIAALQALWTQLGLSGKLLQVGMTVQTASGSGGITITYPKAFGGAPNLVIAVLGGESATLGYLQMVSPFAANNFSVRVINRAGQNHTAGGSVPINWLAVGPAPAATSRPAPPNQPEQA